jgi:RNA polymerase sigma factor (sigma-70 family)
VIDRIDTTQRACSSNESRWRVLRFPSGRCALGPDSFDAAWAPPRSTALRSSGSAVVSRDSYRARVLALDVKRLRLWLQRITGDAQSVDDLCQDVYERLLRVTQQTLSSIRSVENYAYGVALHVALDWIRRRRASRIEYRARIEDLPSGAPQPDPEALVAGSEELQLLVAEVERLPERSREALIRFRILGYSVKEVAAQMGIEPSTVKNHLQTAAKRCEEALERPHPGEGPQLLAHLLRKQPVV